MGRGNLCVHGMKGWAAGVVWAGNGDVLKGREGGGGA